jgi:hypothetical protein
MKIPKLGDKAKKVLKFEVKLLFGVLVGAILLAWVLNTAIYSLAAVGTHAVNNFANGYATSFR